MYAIEHRIITAQHIIIHTINNKAAAVECITLVFFVFWVAILSFNFNFRLFVALFKWNTYASLVNVVNGLHVFL